MKPILTLALAVFATFAGNASADDGYPRSETRYGGVHRAPLDVTARAGFFDYTRTAIGPSASKAIGGLSLDWNASETVGTASPIYYGATTGLSFTRLDNGLNNSLNNGSNLFIVPANVLLGYHVTDQFLAAANTGVNFLLQGDPSVLGIGTSDLKAVPNLGLNASYSFTDALALAAKADWSFADGQTPFTGTLGLSIPLGG